MSDKWFKTNPKSWEGENNRRIRVDRRNYNAEWMKTLKEKANKLAGYKRHKFIQEATVVKIEQIAANYKIMAKDYDTRGEEYEKIKEAYKKLVKQLMELDHNEQIGEQILTQSGKTLENVREEHRDSIRDGLLG